jgi:signal transduction histidine kinase
LYAHGGRIWASNNAGDGACFTFALPMAAALPGCSADAPAESASA